MRYIVLAVCSLILFVPSLLFAQAWSGTLNLEVAIASWVLAIAAAKFFSRVRWLFACLSACVIAVPPYPYWVRTGDSGGAALHFFYGFTPLNVPWATFVVVLAVALVLYVAIFWSLRGAAVLRPPGPGTTS
jgi:hypothetical protein